MNNLKKEQRTFANLSKEKQHMVYQGCGPGICIIMGKEKEKYDSVKCDVIIYAILLKIPDVKFL